MMCWTSRQVRQGRTCSIRATMPTARGAAADVPVSPSVQPVPCCIDQSDVTCAESTSFRYQPTEAERKGGEEHMTEFGWNRDRPTSGGRIVRNQKRESLKGIAVDGVQLPA